MVKRPPDHRLLRFLARHCAGGIAAGWILLLALVETDAGGFGGLVKGSESGWMALAIVAAGFAITGGAVGMGIAIFALDETGDAPGPPRYKAQDEDDD